MRYNKSLTRNGQIIYSLLKAAHRRFGLARFEIGALLCEIKDHSLWEGRAASFAAFLEEERIKSSAAYLYMKVARKLFAELRLSDKDFEQIATVNMSTLELASRVMTHQNMHEIINILSVLGERDAKQVMHEMADAITTSLPREDDIQPSRKREDQVSKVLSAFYALPDDQRIEVLCALRRYGYATSQT